MRKVFEKEIAYHLIVEQKKRELESCQGFSARDAFKAIDVERFKYLNDYNLRLFLKRMGHQVVKKEITAILRRFDVDGDLKISFSEFNEGLIPVSPEILPVYSRSNKKPDEYSALNLS